MSREATPRVKLKLEDIRIESFATTPDAPSSARGTVRGMDTEEGTGNTCPSGFQCIADGGGLWDNSGLQDEPGLEAFAKLLAALIYLMIPAGSMVPNVPDLLMSQRMRDLIAELRGEFDYVVMDTSPLLPVVDALALATVADKVLLIVEWGQTPLACISEAFKILRPEAHRVAGMVLNKVDRSQLPGYAYNIAYHQRPPGKYLTNA